MRNLKCSVFVVTALVLLGGCGGPTIDASSDEALKQSIENVRQALSDSERAKFDEAISILALSQIDMKTLLADGVLGSGSLEGKVRQSLDGKTGEQVIAEAERIRTERKGKDRQQALDEIQELEAKRAKTEIAREQLKEFKVLRSRFYLRERQFMGKQPVIELTVKNGTQVAVSRAYFEGTLASPNRSVPWHKEAINYTIPGGLEPGEEADWTLVPNMFSDWADVDGPSGAVFTVTVERLDGPDGEPIYSTKEFGEYDQKRLRELKSEYAVQ